MSIELVMPSNCLILCHLILLLLSIFPSIRVFSSESVLHNRWPKYWSFSFSISPSNEYSGLISFRMGWLDLLAVQGTLKSLLQYHIFKASILCCSAFFMVQLLHLYMTIGKTIALTRQTFVGKVMSLILNTLPWFVKDKVCIGVRIYLWAFYFVPLIYISVFFLVPYSAFFIVQLSHPYMTTGETIALTRWTFVDKVMSLLFNMLSRLVKTFLPKSKHLLISWLQYHLQ